MDEDQLISVIEEAVTFGLAAVGTAAMATKALTFCDRLAKERKAAEDRDLLSR